MKEILAWLAFFASMLCLWLYGYTKDVEALAACVSLMALAYAILAHALKAANLRMKYAMLQHGRDREELRMYRDQESRSLKDELSKL